MKTYYDYDKQYWVKDGKPVHHALCGKDDIDGRRWYGHCNACKAQADILKRLSYLKGR